MNDTSGMYRSMIKTTQKESSVHLSVMPKLNEWIPALSC